MTGDLQSIIFLLMKTLVVDCWGFNSLANPDSSNPDPDPGIPLNRDPIRIRNAALVINIW
jgi:hypothetical protein